MSTSIHKPEAIVVLPAAVDGSVDDQRVRAWLARADLDRSEAPQEILSRVVAAIGQPASTDGHAALRFWGQTGAAPTDWVAAADPVYLEARLDHVRLHRLWPNECQALEWQQLLAELQATLAADGEPEIVPVERCGYLRGCAAMPTALFSPDTIDGGDPMNFLPVGPAAAHYQRLLSEIQMTLHDSPINKSREERNLRAINSLWIWGGGMAANTPAREIAPLYADDAVLRGYWLSRAGEVERWPDTLERCADRSPYGFVAVTPEQAASTEERDDTLNRFLRDLRQILKDGELRSLTLLFRAGLTARLRPRQIFRVWRREIPPLFGPADE